MKIGSQMLVSIFAVSMGCASPSTMSRIVPAEAFSRAAKNGSIEDYSFKRITADAKSSNTKEAQIGKALGFQPEEFELMPTSEALNKYSKQDLVLKRSYGDPRSNTKANEVTMGGGASSARGQLARSGSTPSSLGSPLGEAKGVIAAPYGSKSPYLDGPKISNPSLWPDQAQGVFLFNDHRAFNPLDIVTILINDSTNGQKRAQTQSKSEFDILAGITHFFGIETKSWAANNTALDPAAMIQASTENEFKGQGDIQRQAQLKAQLSAVIMEVLPNGVLRVEGSKIVAINDEEEIMVLSGLIRQRDITAVNQVDSNRIANMRIDFYGHGRMSDLQSPGWGAKLFSIIWPF